MNAPIKQTAFNNEHCMFSYTSETNDPQVNALSMRYRMATVSVVLYKLRNTLPYGGHCKLLVAQKPLRQTQTKVCSVSLIIVLSSSPATPSSLHFLSSTVHNLGMSALDQPYGIACLNSFIHSFIHL